MNAITPAKPMPPDQSTAASGMLPTEQTKLRIAISGPTSTFSASRSGPGRVDDEQAVEEVVAEQTDEAGEQEAERDLAIEHRPVVAEVVRDVRPRLDRDATARAATSRSGRVVLVAGLGVRGVLAGSPLQARRDERAQQHGHDRDQQQAADELGQRELPADQDPDHDSELDDEVGRGELEGQRAGRRGALGEQRLGDRDGGIGAGGGGCAERRRERDRSRAGSAERALDALARDPGLHDRRDGEAEHERPPDRPGHQQRVRRALPRSFRACSSRRTCSAR